MVIRLCRGSRHGYGRCGRCGGHHDHGFFDHDGVLLSDDEVATMESGPGGRCRRGVRFGSRRLRLRSCRDAFPELLGRCELWSGMEVCCSGPGRPGLRQKTKSLT